MSTRTYAEALFASACRTSRAGQVWTKLRGRPRRLLDLNSVAASSTIADRRTAGMQTVPISQIRGSEGRCDDFDVGFHSLREHTEECWVSVAKAQLRGVGLPPVALIQVGDVYISLDGHHCISVAAALGQQEIDAVVTMWQVTGRVRENRPAAKHAELGRWRGFLPQVAYWLTAGAWRLLVDEWP
jgi:hypothetical protein